MKDFETTARTIADEFNRNFDYASKANCKELAETFARMVHRTLQQSFMRFVLEYIKLMSSHPELCDGRNEATQKLCAKMASALDGTEGLPFI